MSRVHPASRAGLSTLTVPVSSPSRRHTCAEKYFPIGQAQCCRPSLLYKNGTQRLLRRCDGTVPGACGQPAGGSLVSCDSSDDPAAALALGRLAYGYAHVLKAPGFGVTGGDYIPQAPAECCSVCLDPSEPILALPCEASNFCNGHGHCSTAGRCLCNAGWTVRRLRWERAGAAACCRVFVCLRPRIWLPVLSFQGVLFPPNRDRTAQTGTPTPSWRAGCRPPSSSRRSSCAPSASAVRSAPSSCLVSLCLPRLYAHSTRSSAL